MDFAAFARLADLYADEIPERLLDGLNGGIILERGVRRRPDDPPGLYLLGEYVTDEVLGAMVIIYYGSFRRLLAGEPPEVWEAELRETLRHEIRHHVEARAGVDYLGEEDREVLRRLWADRAGGDAGGAADPCGADDGADDG